MNYNEWYHETLWQRKRIAKMIYKIAVFDGEEIENGNND